MKSTISDYKKKFKIKSGRNGLFGQVPYGYKLVDGRLAVDPKENTVIQKLKNLRAIGHSLGNLAKWLQRSNVPTKNKSVRWTRGSVYKILKRSV